MAPTKKRPGSGPGASPYTITRQSAHGRTPLSVDGGEPSGPCKVLFQCPVCGGGNADYTWKQDWDGRWRWFLGCFRASCKELGRRYPAVLAPYVGAPSGAALLDDPPRYLAHLALGQASQTREAPPLPSWGAVVGWHQRLLSSPEALGLVERRGVSLDVAASVLLGWDGERVTLPMFRGQEILSAKTWRPGEKVRSWPGKDRPWPLYPAPVRRQQWIIVCEGEWDALRLLSLGLPATSVTLGAGTWRSAWAEELAGLRVAVMYDVGAERSAVRAARRLRASGVPAKQVSLRRLGLTARNADASDYLAAGGDPAALVGLVPPAWRRRSRRAA